MGYASMILVFVILAYLKLTPENKATMTSSKKIFLIFLTFAAFATNRIKAQPADN